MCSVTIDGFGLVTRFTENLQTVTTINYSAIANSDTLLLTVAHTKSSIYWLGVVWQRISTIISAPVFHGSGPRWLAPLSWLTLQSSLKGYSSRPNRRLKAVCMQTHSQSPNSEPSTASELASESESELLYDWRFMPISSSRRQASWGSWQLNIFFLQLNSYRHSPCVTSSLTRGWICLFWICLAFVKCTYRTYSMILKMLPFTIYTSPLPVQAFHWRSCQCYRFK
jgi:hypothetical protein